MSIIDVDAWNDTPIYTHVSSYKAWRVHTRVVDKRRKKSSNGSKHYSEKLFKNVLPSGKKSSTSSAAIPYGAFGLRWITWCSTKLNTFESTWLNTSFWASTSLVTKRRGNENTLNLLKPASLGTLVKQWLYVQHTSLHSVCTWGMPSTSLMVVQRHNSF